MAIKVVKHGDKFTRKTCPRCGCVFEFTDNDVTFHGNQFAEYGTIKCPECNHCITWDVNGHVATLYN